MPPDDIAAAVDSTQRLIERYSKLDSLVPLIEAMTHDIDTHVVDGRGYQQPVVAATFEMCARWPELARDVGTLKLLSESYGQLVTALVTRTPRQLFDDGTSLWALFDEAQRALHTAADELDRLLSTQKPPAHV